MLATTHGDVIGVILRREHLHPANVRRAAVLNCPQIDSAETFIRPDVSIGAQNEREELKFLHLLAARESEETEVMEWVQNVIGTFNQTKIGSQIVFRREREEASPHHLRMSIGEPQIIANDSPLQVRGEEDVYDSFAMGQNEMMAR